MKNTFKLFLIATGLISVFTVQAQTRIWNSTSLSNAKASSTEATKLIVRNADKLLKKTIVTIVDKEMTPPSGDKHDYMSMGRYWWPNPTTADGLPYIRKDGVVNREIDKLDRAPLGNMAKGVSTLALAYYFTNEEKYASKAVENIRIWFINKETKMNPNMNFGQTIPGHNNGKGRGEGVLDTYSFVEMLDGVELLKKSPKFTKEDQLALKQWFTTYVDWMQKSEIGNEEFEAKNNHGVAFDIQLVRYALFLEQYDLAKKFISDFPARRLFKQIEPNGSQPLELARTTALGYSVFNLTHFLDMCSMAKSLNIDLYPECSPDGRSISKAIEFLTQFVGTTVEKFPYKQIKDWDKVQTELSWQMYRVDKLTGKTLFEKYYKNLINDSFNDENLIFN